MCAKQWTLVLVPWVNYWPWNCITCKIYGVIQKTGQTYNPDFLSLPAADSYQKTRTCGKKELVTSLYCLDIFAPVIYQLSRNKLFRAVSKTPVTTMLEICGGKRKLLNMFLNEKWWQTLTKQVVTNYKNHFLIAMNMSLLILRSW